MTEELQNFCDVYSIIFSRALCGIAWKNNLHNNLYICMSSCGVNHILTTFYSTTKVTVLGDIRKPGRVAPNGPLFLCALDKYC